MSSPLPILSLARSGATSRAWDAFLAAGLDAAEEVEVLTLKGRLLKDRARLAAGAEQAALFAQSGAAYAQAAALRPDSYPLINAAAMALFAGDKEQAAHLARQVLNLLNAKDQEGETPYWRAATFAEAHLLLGQENEARARLEEAVQLAPQAWEDRAATLRQFARILSEQGRDDAWLYALRPPPVLHFSGMMGLAPDDKDAESAIFEAVSRIAPGSGFGALAAGADIFIAEALLANGAELHVILPSDPADFRMSSVQAFGPAWGPRFDAMMDAATSLTIAALEHKLTRAAIHLADTTAMGMAVETASRFEAEALALRIGPIGKPARQDAWHSSGRSLVRLELYETASAQPGMMLDDGHMLFAVAQAGAGTPPTVNLYPDLTAALAACDGQAGCALDCNVGDDNGSLSERAAAIARHNGNGAILASKAAAMATLAQGLCQRTEPMGEMATTAGPVEVYALFCRGLAPSDRLESG